MGNNILTVSQITDKIAYILNINFDILNIQGEISNLTYHRSGHIYFTLKDEKAQIACVIWKNVKINFTLKEGMKVIVTGELTVYPPRGNYQIKCFGIKPLGQGDLYLAFEALKAKLEQKGYFNIERKREIPRLPLKIGVSTSPTGAAIKDIISTIERRLPIATVYFVPTIVQGEGAAQSIAKAIEILNSYPLDVIIIGRGGGSIEDLWAYNEEITADAIYNSKIPIVSGVGHETDFTIADFVSDKRAPTPTGAAEMVTSITKDDLLSGISSIQSDLINYMKDYVDELKNNISKITDSYVFKSVYDKLTNLYQYLDEIESKSILIINNKITLFKNSIDALYKQCKSLNPYSPIDKGYALLLSNNKLINNLETLGNFITIDIKRKYEIANATINSIKKIKE